jgi:mRNA-degrading endonuclease RelE of RelBE toxin-antitoxin system
VAGCQRRENAERKLAGNYRIRTGDYRIVFTVRGDEVIIWKIGNRGGIYD